MSSLSQAINTLLIEQSNESRLRQLEKTKPVSATEIAFKNNILINFASNDYLGLSQHPLVKQAAIEAIHKYGVGSPSSRLVAGNCELYDEAEAKISTLKGTEAALIFPTGFQANLTIMLTLAKIKAKLFCDKFSHNSILLGARFNKSSFRRFEHNDIADLENQLIDENHNSEPLWAVTESVFSMGDLAPIDELIALSKKHNVHLYVDEAHATGVFGKNGMGFIHQPDNTNVVIGTFGKGCGSFGAYVACSLLFRNFLINFCPGIIYTTALPPSVLASILAALDLIPHMISERQLLLKHAAEIRGELNSIGFKLGKDASQIIYLYTESSKEALQLSQYLAEHRIYAPAIRPPTVPENASGIRLSISAVHSDSNIEYLIQTLRHWHGRTH